MTDDLTTEPPRFSDEHAQRIIEYALELGDRRGTMTAADIRAVLTEMDVPLEVQEQALRAGATDLLLPPSATPAGPSESAAFGVAMGVVTATAMSFVPAPLIVAPALLGLGAMYSGVLAARTHPRGGGRPGRFQVANLLLWAGMGGGFLAITEFAQSVYAAAGSPLTPWAFPLAWLFTSVTGSILSRYEGTGRGSIVDRSPVLRIGRRAWARVGGLLSTLVERVHFEALALDSREQGPGSGREAGSRYDDTRYRR